LRVAIIFIVVVVLLNVVLKIIDVVKRHRSRDRK
jgi:regulatory protein YycI of two-component signal transduction system YycFG